MNKSKLINRIILVSILCTFSCIIIPINKLYAQGPTSPEAASFESVSAQDMVNLLTGDLSYVLPLLQVPSPEGGYPIALSYHAGIGMEQEASWVGLGWTVYPGSINRSISGYADDWKYGKKVNLIYDAGGEYNSLKIGVSVGIGEMVSVGLSVSFTEHRAYGGETTHGTGFSANVSTPLISASLGTDGVGINLSLIDFGMTPFSSEGLSIGVNYNFKSGKISKSIGYSLGVADISYSSGSGVNTSSSLLPVSFNSSNYVDNSFNVVSSGFSATIPIYGINLNISKQKTRYWLFDKTQIESVGALYVGDFTTLEDNAIFPYKLTQDAYEAVYKANANEQYGENNFSFLSYDRYSISSEGISGSIAPSIYQHGSLKLLRQKTNTDENLTAYTNSFYNDEFTKKINNPSDNIYFYFEGNYTSYLKSTSDNWQTPSNILNKITDLNVNNETLITSVNINGVIESNYNTLKKRKINGAYIEVFTNQQIIDNSNTIIEAKDFNRTSYLNSGSFQDFENGIGAYKITSLDGKTYHYSLPVYQKEQFNRSTKKDESFSLRFYEEQSLTPYATHWLLTAITGPDYVDINSNNILDKDDYGYWVEFEYGKWSDGFAWRSPVFGNFESEQSKSYGWGIKEIYYLDKIKTRTHTALFIKEERKDSKSSLIIIGQSKTNPEIYRDQIVKSYSLGSDGGVYLAGLYHNFARLSSGAINAEAEHHYYAKISKHRSLRLSNIMLFKNENIPSQLSKLNGQETTSTFSGELFIKERIYNIQNILGQLLGSSSHIAVDKSWNGEFYDRILDVNDINILTPNIETDAIKVISFNYDEAYPLASGTFNSSADSKGRLTLKNIAFKGKGGIQTMPSYTFKYNQPQTIYVKDNMDDWGYNKNNPTVWSLNSIKNPSGGKIVIQYESDDFYQTASNEIRVFNNGLQFTFYEFNGKLRFKIEKETNNQNLSTVDFNNYFQVGTATTDIWACYKYDYNDFGCKNRTGKIDIPNTEVSVISVASTNVIFETNLSYTDNYRDGLNWFYDRTPVGLEYHPGMIREDKNRGECAEPPGCINVTDRLVFSYFIHSNKNIGNKQEGGLRVKTITTTDGSQNQYSKNHYYNEPGYAEAVNNPNYRSSGITSYKPSRYLQEIPYKSELPSPYVMYSNVIVENVGSNNVSESRTTYKFQTLEPAISSPTSYTMGEAIQVDITQDTNYNNIMVNGTNSTIQAYKYEIRNNSASVGRLLSREVLNSYGQVISKKTNNYKSLNEILQGVSQETFKTYKGIWSTGTNSVSNYKVTSSTKINYPSILESSAVIQGGIRATTYFDKHDFNTGQLLESLTYGGDGTAFKTQIIPAYIKYNKMGSKVDNINNKNMLTQQAANYIYLIDEATNLEKVISVGITTWNNDWSYRDYAGNEASPTLDNEKIWRKYKTYIWKGDIDSNDGTYLGFNQTNDDNFNWGVGALQSNDKWENISATTRYSHFSMPLETHGISNNYAATKMGDKDSKIMAVGNAKYTEMFYSGCEYVDNVYEGEIFHVGVNTVKAHTGKYSVKVIPGGSAFSVFLKDNEHRPGKYKISVWAHKDNYLNARLLILNNNATQTKEFNGEKVFAGDWVQLNHYEDIGIGQAAVWVRTESGEIYYDDFRIHPVFASITSYVYNEWDELWYILGSNGLATKFEYDSSGRLKRTYTEIVDDNGVIGGFKKVSENRYNYKKQ